MRRKRELVGPEMRERILTLRGQGHSVGEIARITGRAEGTIHGLVLEGRRRGDPRCRVFTPAEIGARISAALRSSSAGVRCEGEPASGSSVVSSLNCASSAPVEEATSCMREQAAAAYRAGGTVAGISRQLGRHKDTVKRWLLEAGVELRTPPPQERASPLRHFGDSKPKAKEDVSLRRCLGWCGRMFQSSWKGHRICDRCRENSGAGAFR